MPYAAAGRGRQEGHDGAKNPRTGEQIFAGWPRGSESFGEHRSKGWRQYLTDPKEPSRVGC